jgi:ABC-2 type transport system permease protein
MSWWLRAIAAGARVQISRTRGPVFLMAAVVTPVAYAVVFILMARSMGRADAVAAYVVIAPALIGVWYTAIATGGAVVGDERGSGTLELLVAAPAPAALVILGRVTANTIVSLVSIPLVLLTARLLGVGMVIAEPTTAVIALLALAASTVAVTLLFTSALVFARSPIVIQNLIPFPLYILSGIAFPLTLLPEWVRPLSALIPLTYVADVLRASTVAGAHPSLPSNLGLLAGSTVAYGVAGWWLFASAERSIRASGKVTATQ